MHLDLGNTDSALDGTVVPVEDGRSGATFTVSTPPVGIRLHRAAGSTGQLNRSERQHWTMHVGSSASDLPISVTLTF